MPELSQEDFDKVWSALEMERREHKATKQKLAAFGDASPDMIGRFKLDENASQTARQVAEFVAQATNARVSILTKELSRRVAEQEATIQKLNHRARPNKGRHGQCQA